MAVDVPEDGPLKDMRLQLQGEPSLAKLITQAHFPDEPNSVMMELLFQFIEGHKALTVSEYDYLRQWVAHLVRLSSCAACSKQFSSQAEKLAHVLREHLMPQREAEERRARAIAGFADFSEPDDDWYELKGDEDET